MAALVPEAEPPPLRHRLASGADREPCERLERRRAGENGVGKARRLDLYPPAIGGIRPEARVADLVAVDETHTPASKEPREIGK